MRPSHLMTPIFVAFALLATMPALAAGDAAKGERLFAQCRACHSLGAGENRIGPHLHGLFGRAAGSVEGYAYSAAMRQSGVVWEQDSLDAHLAQPPKFIPGNKMGAMFARGVPNAQDREDLIAFLRQATAQ